MKEQVMVQRVADLFEILPGHGLVVGELAKGSYPLVTASSRNNGVAGRYALPVGVKPFPAHTISVAVNGSPLDSFLQPERFITTGDVKVLAPKGEMSTAELLWWVACLRSNKYRYSYGRKANRTLAGLDLPKEMPDWAQSLSIPNLLQEMLESAGSFTLALNVHLTNGTSQKSLELESGSSPKKSADLEEAVKTLPIGAV